MNVNIYTINTESDGSEIPEMPTGYTEIESIESLVTETDAEIIETGDGFWIIECEWGNGEGSTQFKVEVEAWSIKPHKGGRTETISLRFTPDELARLDAASGNMKRADFIMSLIPEIVYINQDDRYGDADPATIEDYRELNPDGDFTQDEDGIYEDGELIAIPSTSIE